MPSGVYAPNVTRSPCHVDVPCHLLASNTSGFWIMSCMKPGTSIMFNLRSRFHSFSGWNQRYAWGCRWLASLPVARILPKFMKARPIIACDHCWHSRLTVFLAKGVFQIMLVVFPPGSTFNMLSVQQVVRTMWRHNRT